jgi:hypothetical protein
MKQEKPLPIIGLVVIFVGGLGTLLGLLSLYPLAKRVPSPALRQATGLTIFLPLVAFGVTIAAAIVTEYLRRRDAARQTGENKEALERAFKEELERAFSQEYVETLHVSSPARLTLRKRDREDLGLLLSTSPPYEGAVADLRRQLAAITERLEKEKNEIVEVQKIASSAESVG